MKKDIYNSTDEEHHHVIKLLKELPQEKAPNNFEYNLITKIENNNFGLNTKEPVSILPWKIFIPATGTIAAIFIVFLTFFNDADNLENPFGIEPKMRSEMAGNIFNNSSSRNDLGENNIISENDVIIAEKKEKLSKDFDDNTLAKSESKKPDFPFNNSTNLDEVLSKKRNSTKIDPRAALAGRSPLQNSFDGFYIRNEVDKEYVEALKARMDSIKKAHREQQLNRRNER